MSCNVSPSAIRFFPAPILDYNRRSLPHFLTGLRFYCTPSSLFRTRPKLTSRLFPRGKIYPAPCHCELPASLFSQTLSLSSFPRLVVWAGPCGGDAALGPGGVAPSLHTGCPPIFHSSSYSSSAPPPACGVRRPPPRGPSRRPARARLGLCPLSAAAPPPRRPPTAAPHVTTAAEAVLGGGDAGGGGGHAGGGGGGGICVRRAPLKKRGKSFPTFHDATPFF